MDLSEYKPYPKNTRYLVSKDGNIYSLKHKRLLKQILTKAQHINLQQNHTKRGNTVL